MSKQIGFLSLDPSKRIVLQLRKEAKIVTTYEILHQNKIYFG